MVEWALLTACAPLCCRDTLFNEKEKGLYLAYYFPNESPAGWWIGKILTSPQPKELDSFWVNYTKGEEMKEDDDVKTDVSSLTPSTYRKEWVLCAPREYTYSSEAAP